MQPRPYRGTSVVRSEINPVDNAELKAGQGKLPVTGEKRCDQFHIVEVPPQRVFLHGLIAEEFAQLFAKPVYREASSR